MRLLNLNCQRALNPNFTAFLQKTLASGRHKILLLQEASEEVVSTAKKHFRRSHRMIRCTTAQGVPPELCILHSRRVKCLDHTFSYIQDRTGTNFGVLMGVFKTKQFPLLIANVYLPPYLQPSTRARAIAHVYQALDAFIQKHAHVDRIILAGDFNSILPWEHFFHRRVLAPVLAPVANSCGYTYYTQRIEPSDFISWLVRMLGKIGISFRMTIDHVFAHPALVKKGRIRVRSEDTNVSDHLPISIEVY